MSGVTADVALDARMTRRMSEGIRAYVAALVAHLPTAAPDLRVTAVGRGENFGSDEQIGLPLDIARTGARLVHFPTTFAPLLRSRPYVLTIHDAIHLRFPDLFGPATAVHYRAVGIPLARGAARVIVGDARTIVDCEQHFGIPAERCRVVPLGYDPALLAAEEPLPPGPPFVLYAGNHRPHKNIELLCAAWAAMTPGTPLDLYLTGPPEPELTARYSREGGTLRFLGHLHAKELRRYFRAASGYVHAALAEGFGIPMLEAAVCGVPVIASSSAVPALVAPYAATFDPTDAAALTALIEALVADRAPFAARAAEGAVALRAYTWHRFAAATAAVYREVLECL